MFLLFDFCDLQMMWIQFIVVLHLYVLSIDFVNELFTEFVPSNLFYLRFTRMRDLEISQEAAAYGRA